MATLQTVVCDLCGKPAHAQLTIDVCQKHEEQAAARMNGGSPQSIDRYHATGKSACPWCGLPYFPQGMAQHVKNKHPEHLKEWRAARDGAKTVVAYTGSDAIRCPYCRRPTSPNGIYQHIKGKHPDKLREWKARRKKQLAKRR
jgi:hypothetical protein